MSRLRQLSVASGVVCALVIASCGGDSSPNSPFMPTPLGAGPVSATGATIQGTIQTTGGSSATAAVTTATDSSPITVEVVGTSIAAVADASGQFLLRDVPAGDVQLHFTGSGVDASLALASVQTGQTVTIVVLLAGTTAVLDSERRSGPGDDSGDDDSSDDDEVEVKGIVGPVSGSCPDLTFTVNGTTVMTNSLTEFRKGTCDDIVMGAKIELEGIVQPDGTIVAKEIDVDRRVELEGIVGSVSGSCPNLTFTVNGTTVMTSNLTDFHKGACGDVVVGAEVEVKGVLQPDGTVLASRVDVETDDDPSDDDSKDDDSKDDKSNDDDSSGS